MSVDVPVILTIIFVSLKISGVIQWSWYVVLLPVLALFGFIAILILVAIFKAIFDRRDYEREKHNNLSKYNRPD